jgi:2-haloalkanoic acid dehalogenase type II
MRPKVATFDCYGTLVDWEGGIGAFLYALMLREGVEDPPPGRELRKRWEEIQFELVRGPYKPYKEILAEATVAWCHEVGIDDADMYGPAIVGSIRAWQPFPDTRPALTVVRDAGVRLVILSNTDRDIISHSVKQIGIEFDHVIVAEDVGSYKHDIGPAKLVGLRTAWVNRHQEPLPDADTVPDHEWRDLWGLADLAAEQ